MEIWFILLLSLCLCAALRSFLNLLNSARNTANLSLPPGPSTLPIIGNFLWLRKSFFDLEPILRNLRAKYGPILTLHIGSRPVIFITNNTLAHQALIQNGATFADRPPAFAPNRVISSNQHNINSAAYGPVWRLLRRNLTSQILHPSHVKSYAHARKWVLYILTNKLMSQSESGNPIRVLEHFQYAMFCLLVFMCFGEKFDETVIREIEDVERTLLVNLSRFNILAFFPSLGKIVFRKRWNQLFAMRHNQENVLIPLIRARQEQKEKEEKGESVMSYVDTLFDLRLPDGRKLNEEEMVTLCNEFLNAGTDTTATALQWIMANLVKHKDIQAKLVSEIKEVVRPGEEIREEDLQMMPYLKAVVLEGLRRHPPGHFVLPHAVTEDISLGSHVIPKNATVNFTVAEMGWDPNVWDSPMEFRPERFLSNGGGDIFDVTGSREIKMMPFGVGRRICPGLGLALLHLEYFVANLIKEFEWTVVDGDDIDLSEKMEFTVVMKYPLQRWLCQGPSTKFIEQVAVTV